MEHEEDFQEKILDKTFTKYALRMKLDRKETRTFNKLVTVYPDIDNWRACRVTPGHKGFSQAYSIHTSRGKYVAFIKADGDFFMTHTIKKFQVVLRQFNTGKYPNTGELKQAVRYAYLLYKQSSKKK